MTGIPFPLLPVGWTRAAPARAANHGSSAMKKAWRKPKTTEIAVGDEINAYVCATL